MKIPTKLDKTVPKLFPLAEKMEYAAWDGEKKAKKKAKKKPKFASIDVDQSNIVKRPRRKKKVDYSKFY